MNVEVKDMPQLRVAMVRHRGPYDGISSAFDRLGKLAGQAGLFGPDSKMIALYYDAPETTAADELRSAAGITVSPDAELPAGLDEERLPAGRYLCTTHLGSYDGLGDAWAQLTGERLPESAYNGRDGVNYEIYRNNPSEVQDDELRTELYIPVA
jgi:AraC family transcriptional regulator